MRRDEDPPDDEVGFGKVERVLGLVPERTVPDGIREVAAALDAGQFGDPSGPGSRN